MRLNNPPNMQPNLGKTNKVKLEDVIRYILMPLSLFFLFKNGIDTIIIFFINNIFSYCHPENYLFDCIIVFLFLIMIYYSFRKIDKGAKIPIKLLYIYTSCIVIYLSYRLNQHSYIFTPIKLLPTIKLLDVVISIPMFCFLYQNLKKQRKHFSLNSTKSGFDIDQPRIIKSESDLLNRNKFIQEVAQKIINTNSPEGSFPIGIVAPWGMGKTTFLNTLLAQLKNENVITIELNVWKCTNSVQIIETLFKLIKEQLKPYSFSIDNKLQEYTNNLLKGMQNDHVSGMRNLSEMLFPSESIEKQYDSINTEIQNLDKKIIIAIDDLDRLDKQEIYNVIRLIRNTANFSNTFFIVSYDRNYILNAIEEINKYQAHQFLEKIFQIEFTLPSIDNKILQNEITERLQPILSEKGKEGYKVLLDFPTNFLEDRNVNLTSMFIKNMRDVTRFVNSFKLSYEFLKDEIYFPDFYNLELLRFKHPEIFIEFYRNYSKFITNERDDGRRFVQNKHYSLTINKEAKFVLYDFLESNASIYKLSPKDIDAIIYSYSVLFPQPENIYAMRGNYGFLSVNIPSKFDRYFLLGIHEDLSEIEFSNMRMLPIIDFKEKITSLSKNKKIVSELSNRLEHLSGFDNKEDFEKVVTIIFHFANITYASNGVYMQGAYNRKSLADLLSKKEVLSFYNSNIDEYKKFLTTFFISDGIDYTWTDEFINSLRKENEVLFRNIFDAKEISQMEFDNYTVCLSKSDKFTDIVWGHFRNCLDSSHGYEAQRLLREFMHSKKEIDRFIFESIEQIPFDKTFKVGNIVHFVFRSHQAFIKWLKIYAKESVYKEEFIKLYELTQTQEYSNGVTIDFFKIIPVKLNEHLR